ncbi:hypothetical protein CLV84_0642 [Neolewinella xylanilytica]|uniref:Tetratricopeptide repeat protein n=1 Tax=Neolewinella xylanilytica TaxID=1514080 RepID=A0A2S6I879_9BACT|nr:hypothetical protein [Neolewinella xylanilytica]PPK87692.1 hypothetical protein CLV84_0642 [Neolewinella xylanilytica]
MQDGRRLAELRRYATELAPDYRAWVDEHDYPPDHATLHFHRSLIGWYEAVLLPEDPYTGAAFHFVTTIAAVYFADGQVSTHRFPMGNGPLDHLPKPVQLDASGQRLLLRLKEAGDCQQLLLLADYHRMESAALARALDLEPDDELDDRLLSCRDAVTEGDPEMARRYPAAITLAGRQDLMRTLAREAPAPEPIPAPAPAANKESVQLRPRYRIKLPSLSTGLLLAAVLCGVLGWLAYDTFGGSAPGDLYARAFEPYPNIFADTPPQTDAERDLERILYYYDRGDYRTGYDELLPTAPAYPASPLYLGVSALALDDPARAREWFAQLPPDSPYLAPAAWYDALALLALNRRPEAEDALQRIANTDGHPYRAAARELLADL